MIKNLFYVMAILLTAVFATSCASTTPGSRNKIKSFLNEIAGVYNRKNKTVPAQKLRDLSATL